MKSGLPAIAAWSRVLAELALICIIAGFGAPALEGAARRQGAMDGSCAAPSSGAVALFRQVLTHVERDYVSAPQAKRLVKDALRGMVSSLDPYSDYLDASELEEVKESEMGAYCGIGIDVGTVGSAVEILTVVDKSPAARSGLQRYDAIVAVDGRFVGTDANEAQVLLSGEPGTRVRLAIRHGSEMPREYLMRRQCLPIHSVRAALLEANYGYVRLSSFVDTTPKDLRRSVATLEKMNHARLRGLVLDLRDNGGGVLEDGTAVADAFLNSGVIVTAEGRAQGARMRFYATPGDVLHGAPMAVLVNKDSASAAEIVAGALRDHARATLIGSPTYGKGSIQTIYPLSRGALKLTTAHYFTPDGAPIPATGIVPDIAVEGAAPSSATTSAEVPRANLTGRDPEIRIALNVLERRTGATAAPSASPP